MNPLQRLGDFGQSPWLDFIRRGYIEDGSLKALVDAGEIKGVTSNPAIFEQAIARSMDYDAAVAVLTGEGLSPVDVYDTLSIEDVQAAADVFAEVYRETDGLDGYVSLEVSPHLANDTEGTINDARRLWARLDRPNVMIKVPATEAGIPAIKTLIAEGINVNVTLLFSVERYVKVAEAYIEAISERAEKGLDLRVASVASFFVSRVDTMVDPLLDSSGHGSLRGTAAVANSLMAYKEFQRLFGSDQFKALKEKGAWVQRLLWASTSTKDPSYPKTKYVNALVGPDTVDTIPLQTVNDYREEGDPADRLTGAISQAEETVRQLQVAGIDLEDVAHKLELDGIAKFVEPFDKLIDAIEQKQQSLTV